ncbi:alpha/beta fold hydrolase [Metabacillus iocasae]|uniref:Pimeloyl-ACP methyl ester carboxylesterase n=1 Tax=Priestia iocasae TaxID=2291674 RepID=A0ABS2QUT8_9BACI|nr:alpha/beta hydrolase [Metabacillus iocasae]MBM7702963.1 pimeloyl-ACP methyl ester carboxylesterase [Metabacillus iocasae]
MNGYEINNEQFFIKVKNFKLYVNLLGKKKNKPTVVMDAGYGDYSKAWNKIAPEIAKITEVVLYDRAGLGKSEKSSNKRTSEQMVNELKELLTNIGIEPPYILVGHSFGGVNMRLYATEYPNEVDGLVLVDSTPEDYREIFLPTMSAEFQDAYKKQFIYEGTYHEFMESLKQTKEKRRKLDIPLIVISAGKKAHYSSQSQELWNEMQEELLNISTNSEFIIAKNSTHYIQNDEPSVVINAIKHLIAKRL